MIGQYIYFVSRVTIKYKHVADNIERLFSKDCSITQDNISIQGENGCLFTRSVSYFAAYKNAIQQLEYAARTPRDQIREVNKKIAQLSIEGHILSSRTAFIGVQKNESNKPKPEFTDEFGQFCGHLVCYEPPYDLQRRRQEQLMARRMMNALNDEPASPQPATPPFSPQPNNQYNPMVNPWPGSGNPPPEAVAAAQEMVNILLRNYYVIITQFRCWMH